MTEEIREHAAMAAYLAELIEHGLLIPMGVDGLYGRSALFEEVVEGLDKLITGYRKSAEVLRFPPAVSRQAFERGAYLRSFPHLAGTVHSFMGGEREYFALLAKLEKREDWTTEQKATQVVLTPAACYPVFPALAARGPLPGEGWLVDVYSWCFRHEPSPDPARMQLFRMREYVRIGTDRQVMDFRQQWIERGQEMIAALGLPMKVEVANDPFFGRAGKILAESQREQSLKFELLIPIAGPEPTACLSFNYHQDHFGRTWNLIDADGQPAHSACVGFGMERIALALFRHHGFDVAAWPAAVRGAIGS